MNEQQEREAFKTEMRRLFGDVGLTRFSKDAADPARVSEWWQVWQARAALAANVMHNNNLGQVGDINVVESKLAANVPADLTPLAKRRIYDAIRGAYDLGCVDQQNGTRASREVELDHGNALISGLAAIAYLAAPAPAPEATLLNGLTEAETSASPSVAGLTTPAQAQQPFPQWRYAGSCNWYDGYPDTEDGGGPYETRVLWGTRASGEAKPEAQQPLTDEQTRAICYVGPIYAPSGVVKRTPIEYRRELESARLHGIREAERAHGIGANGDAS